jgi:predicted TIM-barrel fold metal-dependent hydrolase
MTKMARTMPRRVDVHVHYLPPPYVEALEGREEAPRLERRGGDLFLDLAGGGSFPLHPGMTELSDHEEGMASAGIDQEILSITPPGVDNMDASEAVAVARASNDALADLSTGHNDRFRGLAMLPAVDPERAAEELQRAVGLGLRGGVLMTNVQGARLDEDQFRPIFEAAAELDVPIVLHPTPPAQPEPFLGYALMTIVGFIAETTVCTLRLVLSGLFERHNDFKLLVPHVGAAIPYLFGRIGYEVSRYHVDTALSAPVEEYLRRLYLDSVSVFPSAMKLAVDMVGPDRFLFATDEPFWERERAVKALDETGWDGDMLDKVSSGNAEQLFGT